MQILLIHDMLIPNPFSLTAFLTFWVVRHNYLISANHSTDYDKQRLAAYKSFDDYRLFTDGYVESLLTAQLNQESVHVYIAKVRLFMKIKSDEERSTTISGSFLRVEVQTEVAYFRQDRV